MATKTTRVQITLPIATARKALKLAEADSRSLSNYLQHLIETALAKLEVA